MIQDLFEILVAYYQYLANILTTKGVTFTVSWVQSGNALSLSTLDIKFFQSYIPALANDARIFFIVVSILIPLALIFLGLLAFNEPNVVVWYFIALTSVFTLLAGVAAAVISQTIGLSITLTTAYVLMGAGAGGLLLCSILFMCYKLNKDVDEEDMAQMQEQTKEDDAAAQALKERQVSVLNHSTFTLGQATETSIDFSTTMKASDVDAARKIAQGLSKKDIFTKQTEDFRCFPFIQGVLFGLLCAGVGAILVVGTAVVGFNSDALGSFAWVIGVALLSLAFLVLLWTLPSVALRGRQLKWYISNALQENGMRLLILLIMILYIPIGSSSIAIFNCNEYQCPTGYRLVDRGTAYAYNTTDRSGQASGPHPYCIPCNVSGAGQQQRAPPSLLASACQPGAELRLESSPETRCATMQRFFWPAAGLALVFVVGAPFMFFFLIRRGCAMLKEDFPVDPRLDDWEAIWEAKIVESANVSKFLYQPFEYKYRYWRLAQILQKLAIVITGTYVFKTPWAQVSSSTISLGCALLVHVIMSVAYFITEPFIRLYDDGVCTVLHWGLVTCCVIAMLILYDNVPPEAFNLAIIIVYLLLPVVLFVVGIRLEFKWAAEAEAQAEEDQRVRVVEHMQAMDAKGMRAAIEERKRKLAAATPSNPLNGPGSVPHAAVAAAEPSEASPAFGIDDDEVQEPQAARPVTAIDGAVATAKQISELVSKGRDVHQRPTFDRPGTTSRTGSSRGGDSGGGLGGTISSFRNQPSFRAAPSFRSSGLVRPGTTTESSAAPMGEGEGSALALARIGTASRFSMKEALSRANAEASATFERSQNAAATASFRGAPPTASALQPKSRGSMVVRRKESVAATSVTNASDDILGDSLEASGVKRGDLEHSSDDEDLAIEDKEEQAKQEERRAALMASVLRAEAARKAKKDGSAPLEGSLNMSSSMQAGPRGGGASSTFQRRESDIVGADSGTASVEGEESRSAAQAQEQQQAHDEETELAANALEIIEAQIAEERALMQEKQQDVDLAINIWTRRSMNRFLMLGGFVGFAALGVSLLGVLSTSPDVNVSVDAPMTTDGQLAGYLTWDFFATSCACNAVSNNGADAAIKYVAVEQWICDNGKRMERVRVRRSSASSAFTDGFAVRPMCGGYFSAGCSLTLNRDASVALSCPSNITSVYPGVDLQLW